MDWNFDWSEGSGKESSSKNRGYLSDDIHSNGSLPSAVLGWYDNQLDRECQPNYVMAGKVLKGSGLTGKKHTGSFNIF